MGSASSKEASGEGVAFQNSAVPIQFSSPLVQKLDDPKLSTSNQSLEQLIQARVAEELKKLRSAEQAALAQTTYDLSKDNAGGDAGTDELSSIILQADLDLLKKKVEGQSARSKKDTKEADDARDSVIACLRRADGRSLDCRAEVLQLKKAVADLQKGFIERYQ